MKERVVQGVTFKLPETEEDVETLRAEAEAGDLDDRTQLNDDEDAPE